MNSYLKGVIARLKTDLAQANELVEKTEAQNRAANQKQRDIESALAKYIRQAQVEGKQETLGVRSRTVELAQETLTRCEQNMYLREGNRRINASYWEIRRFVKDGNMSTFFDRAKSSPLRREIAILGWCHTIMSHDSAQKTVRLSADIDFESNRIRDEIDNTEVTND